MKAAGNQGGDMAESDWEKIEELGKGGQGVTWLVKSKADSSLAVMKLLRNPMSEQARSRMYREVAALRSLSALKARVPAVFDDNTISFGDDTIQLYFVMERIEGKTLRELVTERKYLPLEEASSVVNSLLETLDIGIKAEVVHRDIKPENIIVRGNNLTDVVMVDYGLSFNKREDSDLTKMDERFDNRFLSLPERRAPDGNKRDPRSDITGVAGIFYFCLTGHDPVDLSGADGKQTHRRVGRLISEKHPGSSWVPRAELLFDKAFTHDIELRFQNVDELRARVRNLTDGSSLSKPKSDMLSLAKRSSETFRKHDRPTQLAHINSVSNSKWSALLGDFASVINKLKPHGFTLGVTPIEAKQFRLDADEYFFQGYRVVMYQGNNSYIKWFATYAAIINQSEVTVVRRTFLTNEKLDKAQQINATKWEPVTYFDGNTGPSNAFGSEVREDLEARAAQGIVEITSLAFPNVMRLDEG